MALNPIINQLVAQARKETNSTAAALELIVKELNRVAGIVDPDPTVQSKVNIPKPAPPKNVDTFDYELTDSNVILTWTAPQDGFLLYEIRLGSSWDTATRILTTGNLSVILDPIAVGTTTYLIKAINDGAVYSDDADSVAVIIPAIGSFTVTPGVINNFISLDWDQPTSQFRIEYYIITKDAAIIASRVSGTFWSRQESLAGSFTYGVTAVDIAGNESSEITVTVDVNGPTDFDVQDSQTSDLSGTIVNGAVENSRLLVCLNLTETFQQHFVNNAWATPQAQIDAGYPIYIQPTLTTASYEEIFDFGTIYTNVIVNLSYLFETLEGSFTFGIDVRVSDDNITYSSAYVTSSFFVTSARYVKVHFDFTGASNLSLLAFSNFVCTLSVKREVDGGEASVFSTDASGTVISFNKAFKFVESITVTVKQTATRFVTYDFAGGSNPTTFKVKVWDSGGTRVSETVSWKARGVL
jgi:hypothetical protein